MTDKKQIENRLGTLMKRLPKKLTLDDGIFHATFVTAIDARSLLDSYRKIASEKEYKGLYKQVQTLVRERTGWNLDSLDYAAYSFSRVA